MKVIKAVISFIAMLFCGMQGGQGKIGGKSLRRFGLPITAVLTGLSFKWNWRYLAFLALIPILSMGYGVDSQLGALLGHCELLIRVVYGLLVAIPLVVFGLWRWVVASVCLMVAFSIHAGSLGNIPWFGDILIEDIIRYSTLAVLVIWNILFCKE